ncbi:UNVERIFIED_CONTAM: Retrovirus-related Pol polyprotein from transposon TNT 1-94 [Sesamum calycinum]|uniref:Retrovirus-related Pol polyprotein from transposon TNT 1-94 n=1 Tax=Sesamum calycinum TaxID=2727403 RepID=A0AAW2PNH4_9LAMI
MRNLRIVLDYENPRYIMDKPLPQTLPDRSSSEERETFEKWHADHRKVRNIILASMSNDVQKQYDRLDDVASILQRMKEFMRFQTGILVLIGEASTSKAKGKRAGRCCVYKKDLSEASYILGIKLFRDRSKRILGMTQNSYVEKVLKRFKMEHSKRVFLPMRHGVKLSNKQSPKTDDELKRILDIPYASTVGRSQHAVQCTRPDIAYALSVMSRYQACAGEAHWTAVKIILKYLRKIKDVFLVYSGGELILEGFSDASFQSDDDDANHSRDLYSSLPVVWWLGRDPSRIS